VAETIEQRIVVNADADGAVRELRRADDAVDRLDKSADRGHKSMGKLGVAAGVAAGQGLVAATRAAFDFGKTSYQAFKDAEVAQGRAEAMLDKNNAGWRRHKDQVDKTIESHVRLGAFDDEELYGSFANLARVTGDLDKATRAQAVAMDLARGRGISLEQATTIVNKAYLGSTTALQKMGVQVDKGAKGMEALDAIQRQFGGQAEKFANSEAGKAERMSVAWGNFQETIGQALVPAMGALFDVAQKVLPYVQAAGVAVAAKIQQAWPFIVSAMRGVWEYAQKFWVALQPLLSQVGALWQSVADKVAEHWPEISTVMRAVGKVVETTLKILVPILTVFIKAVGVVVETWIDLMAGVIRAIQAIVGPVGKAATAVWGAVSAAITAPLAVGAWLEREVWQPITSFVGRAVDRGREVASAVWRGFTGFATDVGTWVTNRIVQPLQNAVGAVSDRGGALARNIWAGFTAFVTDMGTWITNRIVTPITTGLARIMDRGEAMARNIWAGFTSFVTTVGDWIQNRIIDPLTNWLGRIRDKGGDIAEAIATGMKRGADAVVDTVVTKFKGFLNAILRVVNKVPFVNIPLLAEGTVTRGPQLAVIGEDGTEVVVPTSPKYRKRGLEMLSAAATLMGVGAGQGPAAIPAYAAGQVVLSGATAAGSAQVRDNVSRGVGLDVAWDALTGIFNAGAGAITGLLPDWTPMPILKGLNNLGDGIRSAASSFITGAFSVGRGSLLGPMIARAWAIAQMGKPYVWGGGHGGWNYGLPGYDCSGFASHAAKKAGAAIGGPGTTMSLFPLVSGHPASPGDPVAWGFRGMENSDPRSQHMGIRILGTWYQFGNPGRSGGGDSQWAGVYVPPGLPGYASGVDYVPATGPAVLHMGEAVLNRQDADAWRRSTGGVQVIVHPAMGWLEDFIEVRMDRMAEDSRRRARAAGAVI